MSKYKIHDGSLYDYTSGIYCGVLIKENVMKKLAALQTKHLQEVKRLLSDEADEENVFPSDWTLHHPEGEQRTVRFINSGEDVRKRIASAVVACQPKHCPVVFIASGYEEAREMADERFSEDVA